VLSDQSGGPTQTGFDLLPKPALATLSGNHKSCKSFTLTVASEDDWEGVLDTLGSWKEMGCWSANIDLNLRIDRIAKSSGVIAPLNMIIKIDSDDEVGYLPARKVAKAEATLGQSGTSKKPGPKLSKTEKALQQEAKHEELDEICKSHVKRICKENRCLRETCERNGMPCRLIGDVHIKVYSHEVSEWSDKIEKGYATFWQPHPALQKALEKRAAQVTDRRETSRGKSKNKSKNRNSSSSSTDCGRTKIRKRSRRGSSRENPSITTALLAMMATGQLANRPPVSYSVPRQELASSPPRMPRNLRLRVSDYLRYLAVRDPERTAQWTEAQEQLDANYIKFDQLGEITVEMLQGIGIPLGIAHALKKGVKKYIQKKEREDSGDSELEEHNETDV
jgi:hypothetical protein